MFKVAKLMPTVAGIQRTRNHYIFGAQSKMATRYLYKTELDTMSFLMTGNYNKYTQQYKSSAKTAN